MLEHGKELIVGMELIMKVLGVKRTIVGIENNKQDAIEELNKNVSYQFLIRLELYKLIKHIIGEKEYKGFEMWW